MRNVSNDCKVIVKWLRYLVAFTMLMAGTLESLAQLATPVTFQFGKKTVKNSLPVRDETLWPFEKEGFKYGILGDIETKKNYITAEAPFSFWVALEEGNYRVQVVVGGPEKSHTTIKAESRRLMVYDHYTAKSDIDTLEFIVNVRSARINDEDSIRLKSREFSYLNWDQHLSLEFGGERPCIRSVTIARDEGVPVVFLAGNSTVVDQENDPWASWGQMFPLFLKPEIVVANYAESGETLKSFIWENRLQKIASLIKPGDFLFMEFAHNDQKPGSGHVEPYTTYIEYLMKFVSLARGNGATPVLVTSTNRRKFNSAGEIENTLAEYPDAMRKLAKDEDLFLVDLNAMSKELYEALGVEGSKKAFVHYPARSFPGQYTDLADNTHFSTYGAWQLAKSVVRELRSPDSPMKAYIKEEVQAYDPANPDDFDNWKWPVAGKVSQVKPDGN